MSFLSNTQFPRSENPLLPPGCGVAGFVGILIAMKTCGAALVFGIIDIVIPLIASTMNAAAVPGLLTIFGAFLTISVVILAISGLLLYYSENKKDLNSIQNPYRHGSFINIHFKQHPKESPSKLR